MTGWLPREVARLTVRELAFVRHWCHKTDIVRMSALIQGIVTGFERILGVYWRSEDIFNKDGKPKELHNEIRIPLAVAMNLEPGGLYKLLRKNLSSDGHSSALGADMTALKDQGEKIGSLMDLDKDDFYAVINAIEKAKYAGPGEE